MIQFISFITDPIVAIGLGGLAIVAIYNIYDALAR